MLFKKIDREKDAKHTLNVFVRRFQENVNFVPSTSLHIYSVYFDRSKTVAV